MYNTICRIQLHLVHHKVFTTFANLVFSTASSLLADDPCIFCVKFCMTVALSTNRIPAVCSPAARLATSAVINTTKLDFLET